MRANPIEIVPCVFHAAPVGAIAAFAMSCVSPCDVGRAAAGAYVGGFFVSVAILLGRPPSRGRAEVAYGVRLTSGLAGLVAGVFAALTALKLP